MDAEQRKKHVLKFKQHNPNLQAEFSNPQKVKNAEGKKKEKKTIAKSFHRTIESDKKRKIMDHLFATTEILFKLLFRLQVPRYVGTCQGNCGNKQIPFETDNYVVVKSQGTLKFTENGEERKRKTLNITILTISA